ncbi:MAG: hypothetical protein O3A78_11120 [Nitrospinae bacterium]|jgi:hypothetical protein|nr:hypothetical protein [Nitrospinota bacterium]MDA1110338.1 hypothetical protein [Nitrospinota bacterium]
MNDIFFMGVGIVFRINIEIPKTFPLAIPFWVFVLINIGHL